MKKPPTNFTLHTRNFRLSKVALACFIFFANTSQTHCQATLFRGDTVKSIVIQSSVGYYNFDKEASIGTRDTLVLEPASANWQIKHYYREHTKAYLKNDKFVSKGKALSLKNNWVRAALVDSFLHQLNQSHYAANHQSFGYDANSFSISPKMVSLRAKKNRGLFYKEDYRSSKSTKCVATAKEMSDVRLFDEFLQTTFDSAGYIMVSDVWDEMHIEIVTQSRSYHFEGKYPNILKIPWYDWSTGFLPKCLVNPSINKYLLLILPKQFLSRERLQPHQIMDHYMDWFWFKKEESFEPNY